MNTPVTLHATDKDEACRILGQELNEPSGTRSFLLVLGNDAISQKGRDYVQHLLAAAPQDYESVRFIFVPTVSFVKDVLCALNVSHIKPDPALFSWNDYDELRVLSISPNHHLVSGFIKSPELDLKPGKIRTAILAALSNGSTEP